MRLQSCSHQKILLERIFESERVISLWSGRKALAEQQALLGPVLVYRGKEFSSLVC